MDAFTEKGGYMRRQELFDYLQLRLCNWCSYIKYCNCKSFNDINKVAENFIRNLLEIVYDWDLVDLNRDSVNFPGLDLGNNSSGVGVQVTSSCDSQKVLNTYKKIYNPQNSIDGRLIAEVFDKRIIFICISMDKKIKFSKHTMEQIKEISHNRFQFVDIINMPDIIREIEDLFDKDYDKFLKAYKCIAKNIDEMPEPVTNKRVLEDMVHYFDRPAFRTDFNYECSLEDFDIALTETIKYINMGKRNKRAKTSGFSKENFSSKELKRQFGEIVDGLNLIRKLYRSMYTKGYAHKIGRDNVMYIECATIFCRAMNDVRAIILHYLSEISKENNVAFELYPEYYNDSFWHSPFINGEVKEFLPKLKEVYDYYIKQ